MIDQYSASQLLVFMKNCKQCLREQNFPSIIVLPSFYFDFIVGSILLESVCHLADILVALECSNLFEKTVPSCHCYSNLKVDSLKAVPYLLA